jgi:signal transduction histidine kinase
MNYKNLFRLFLIFIISLNLHAYEVCANLINHNSYNFETECNLKDCWIGFLAPEDSVRLKINDEVKMNLFETNLYVKNESFYFQINQGKQYINIEVQDRNHSYRPSKKLCIEVGRYWDAKLPTSVKWFFITGSSIFSSYFLFLCTMFSILIYFLNRDKLSLSLIIYCICSCLYLLSFSEYPRSLFDSVLFSGGIHFPLRLIQDVSLINVFYHFYKAYDFNNLIKKISYIYLSVITYYFLMIVIGIREYALYEKVILIMAPLVAGPMAIGFFFSLKLTDQYSKKILVPISLILFICQLNDLFCFWGMYEGYFTVRLYIPFLVGLMLFFYFRELYLNSLSASINIERERIVRKFVHDLKSPLAALRGFSQVFLSNSPDAIQLMKQVIRQVELMSNELTHTGNDSRNVESIALCSLLNSIIEQKEIELKNLKVEFTQKGEIFVLAEEAVLIRALSNLINNSYESYAGEDKKLVNIEVGISSDYVQIRLKDFGCGMNQIEVERALKGQSRKSNGSGIGLSSTIESIKKIGGRIELQSSVYKGTTVIITLQTAEAPFWYYVGSINIKSIFKVSENLNEYLINSKNVSKGVIYSGKYKYDITFFKYLEENAISIIHMDEVDNLVLPNGKNNYDAILVDDDKYVCLSWEMRARQMGLKFKTYRSYNELKADLDNISRDATIYLDRYVKDIDFANHLNEIKLWNFRKVILISSEFLNTVYLKDFEVLESKEPPF